MNIRQLLVPGLLLLASACAATPGPGPQVQSTPAPPSAPAAPTPATAPKQDAAQAERPPGDGTTWTNLGITHERQGRHDEAERSYRQALELAPEQQAAWDNLTRLQCRTGRAAQTETWLREHLQTEPDAIAPRLALVQALLCQKKLDAAATEAKRVLKAEERNVRAMLLLSQVYHREHKYELARMVLENARTITPGEAAIHNALGLVLLALGARPAALESFKKASELKPDFAEARNNHGALLNEAQDHAAATRELEAAVQAAPDFAEARLNLGNAYRGLGDFSRALAEYQQVLRLAPTLPGTYFNLAILHLDAEPQELDTLVRLQSCLSYFEQYRARGGRDERVDDYVKDAKKGIEKEERRREREKREQLRKAPPAPPTSGSDRVAEDKK